MIVFVVPTSIASLNPVVTAGSMRLFLKRGRGDADQIRVLLSHCIVIQCCILQYITKYIALL